MYDFTAEHQGCQDTGYTASLNDTGRYDLIENYPDDTDLSALPLDESALPPIYRSEREMYADRLAVARRIAETEVTPREFDSSGEYGYL